MARVTFITGGARSGKSKYAQQLALQQSRLPVYIATARTWDADFMERIDKHRDQRGPEWTTFEEEKRLSSLPLEGRVAVIDCVTLWITNYFSDSRYDVEASLEACQKEFDALVQQDTDLIIIGNEIGMGVHAPTEAGRKFTDLHGWINQYIAARANRVIFMVSGIPLTVK
ncbi:MAG: bifunctional adenosylcobinamide kinase/adenosylcobinamide-phosphate guanylyltransferase [Bacteroidetes bacterium]|nr:bifunctional adenosylcobinamide kinase/adenosylcobinamide-phosphate guanylyltransferase [Bacteroidota bacterium]